MKNNNKTREQYLNEIGKLNDKIIKLEKYETKRKKADYVLKESEEKYRSLFNNMSNGFALHKIVLNENNVPIDYTFIEINDAFENQTGLKKRNIIGKNVTKVLPGIDKDTTDWIGIYCKVALTQKSIHFENYAEPLNKWYSVNAYSPQKGYFATIFEDITERKQLEETLKSSEERLKIIFESAPDAIYLSDFKGTFIDGNKAAEDLLGYKKEELIGKSFLKLKLLSAKELFKASKLLVKNFQGKGTGPDEFLLNHKDGSQIPVEISTYPVKIKNKKLALGIARNISERKRTDQLQSVVYEISKAAQEVLSLDELHKLIHNSLKKVLDVTNFYIAYFDEEENLLSFPFYKDSKDIFPGTARPLGKGLTEYVIRTGKPFILKRKDIEAYAKKGEIDVVGTLPEVWMGAPLITDNKVIGVIALNSYHDPNLYTKSDLKILNFVSEQIAKTIKYKQALTDLQVEKTYLNELFTSSPEALALVNTDSTILHINKQFTTLFGYREDEVVGRNIDELLTVPKHRENARKITMDAAMGKDQYFDTVRKKKDGTMINVSILSSPVNYKGDTLAVYAIYRDITERIKATEKIKKSEEQYRTLSEELTESNLTKELLLDVIAHDLKNPAGVIKGFAEFGLENDPNSEILKEINGGADNLLNVISNATTLSKVTIGDKIEKEELNLVEIINVIIKENLPQLEYEEMTLDIKLKGELIVKANPIIGEVFRNYISNAIKYAKTGKKLIIDAIVEDGYVTVKFKDFGKTIEKKDRENIFIRNVQLGKTKGQGLGLAIVKRIAEAHSAEIGVKPNNPTGNIFYIKIPVL